jgi:hypothetical protein
LISTSNLDLDLLLPPCLSLSTIIDILKLLCDDDGTFQATSKGQLLECLKNMHEIEAEIEKDEQEKAIYVD